MRQCHPTRLLKLLGLEQDATFDDGELQDRLRVGVGINRPPASVEKREALLELGVDEVVVSQVGEDDRYETRIVRSLRDHQGSIQAAAAEVPLSGRPEEAGVEEQRVGVVGRRPGALEEAECFHGQFKAGLCGSDGSIAPGAEVDARGYCTIRVVDEAAQRLLGDFAGVNAVAAGLERINRANV